MEVIGSAEEKVALKARHRLFADYIASGYTQTDAARLAGYKGDDGTLASTGSKLVRNPKIKAYLEKVLAEKRASASEILGGLALIARASMADFLDIPDEADRDVVVNLRKAAERGQLAALKKFKQVTKKSLDAEGTEHSVTITEIELHDPLRARKMLIDVLGLAKHPEEQNTTGISASEQRLLLVAERMRLICQRD